MTTMFGICKQSTTIFALQLFTFLVVIHSGTIETTLDFAGLSAVVVAGLILIVFRGVTAHLATLALIAVFLLMLLFSPIRVEFTISIILVLCAAVCMTFEIVQSLKKSGTKEPAWMLAMASQPLGIGTIFGIGAYVIHKMFRGA